LNQAGISLVVSTYQAGKLIVMRADGDLVNTHFRVFQKPMGLAATHDRLAIGTAAAIWELRNIPATAPRVEPQGKHDACYLPRDIHITGDIDIHEMAWAGEELWFINTRFSCLCTADKNHSFVPRWRPPFISAYDLRDRCHLNGLGTREGQPHYVTALGQTDDPGGWRKNKASGGILMDITTNEILLQGLSMPHSPRWYHDRLWVLESGKGSLAYLDPLTQQLVTVAQLPGFTRGLDFWGNLAFIGLSQVRESAVFSGLPLTQTLTERICGVWVVDIRNGETLAFLRFEEAVQEIFAVAVLPGIRFPEVIDWDAGLMGTSYVLPDAALANVVKPSQEWEFAETYFEQGNKLYYEGRLPEAVDAYRRCLKLQPSYLPAQYNLGVTLGDLERYEEAVQELEQVIAAEASHADACNSLGFVYSKQRQLEPAIAYYRKAIAIRPDFAKAHHNLGMTLLQQGNFEEGWAESEWRWQTEQFTPFKTPHPRWQGEPIPDKTLLIHTEQGAGDAIQFIRYVPMAAARCKHIILVCTANLIPLFETLPEFFAFWAEFRTAGEISLSAFDTYIPLMSLPYLFKTSLGSIPSMVPYLKAPLYEFGVRSSEFGVAVAETLRDQSFSCGDTMPTEFGVPLNSDPQTSNPKPQPPNSVRVASPQEKPQTPNPEPRTPNSEPRTPNSELRTPNPKLQTPNSKLQTPNSKPRTPNSEPRTPNSELRTPNSELRTPNSELRTPNSELKIGIVWAGSSIHANDRNRSCTVQDFLPLLQVPNVTFYSLQVGDRASEISQLPPEIQIHDLSDRLKDYGATAAAIDQLDLVITVDTSVAHLAGAIGKPVWTLLCYNPDWRWLLDRSDSPWYPTMTLFRQPTPHDWQSVFNQVIQELQKLL
jgi:uncharacterized protein (TIGR03032 family)